jgi:hypothetical protein
LRAAAPEATWLLDMFTRTQFREFRRSKPVRSALFVLGLLLILISPIVGAIPGPGGVLVLIPGLALTLQNSDWAKRQYVKFKKWQPKAGRWTDWGLRRRSAKRREAVRKMREEMGCPPLPEDQAEGPIATLIPNPPAKVSDAPGNNGAPAN